MEASSRNSKKINPLHLRIGDSVYNALRNVEGIVCLKDKACGGNQHIPLFCTSEKSRETEFCNVDLMILKNNKIKVILEIEESNVKPTQVCGKFLTSALSRFYMHQSHKNEPIELDSVVTFIQILDSSKLDDKTRKLRQWNLLENSIRAILPVQGSSIKQYILLFGSDNDFCAGSSSRNRLVSALNDALKTN